MRADGEVHETSPESDGGGAQRQTQGFKASCGTSGEELQAWLCYRGNPTGNPDRIGQGKVLTGPDIHPSHLSSEL